MISRQSNSAANYKVYETVNVKESEEGATPEFNIKNIQLNESGCRFLH